MKKIIKKSLGILLVLFSVLSCFNGCVNGSTFHTHDFKQKADETRHFKECECGESTDIAEHTFEWIIDSEPTYTEPGYKHQECSACGYKTDENTQTERLLHEETIIDTEIRSESSTYSYERFYSKDEFVYFLDNNKIDSKFLCVNAVSDSENNIYVIFEDSLVSYKFIYDNEESQWVDDQPEEYLNPCITIDYFLYSADLGTAKDLGDNDGYAYSIVFYMYFCEINDEIISPTFEFYNYNNSNNFFENIIKVMNNGNCIGEILYSTDGLYVSREWIVDYLSRNLFVLN